MSSKPQSIGGWGYIGSYLASQIPPAGLNALQVLFLDNGTGVPPYGSYQYSDGQTWQAFGGGGGVTTFAALTDATTATIAVTNTSVANALVLKANKGHVDRAADVTTGRAFVSTDFGVGVVPLNAGTVQNFTLNTAVTMGIAGTGNVLPIQILGAVHTLTAGVGVTVTYGSTSYTNAAVTGFVPVLNQTYVLVQRGTTDTWDLS